MMKRIHSISAWVIILFVVLHLYNHVWSIFGASKHIEVMNTLRVIYRSVFFEGILVTAVIIQIITGLKLFQSNKAMAAATVDRLQRATGLYLAIFFMIHVSAIMAGRWWLNLDTNFYFGVAGLNTFPLNLFFIPYYALAILSFFGHLACIHAKKMRRTILGLSPRAQSKVIILLGICLTVILFYGLTNHFTGVAIPEEYNLLMIGK